MDQAGHPLRWSAMIKQLKAFGLAQVSTDPSPSLYMQRNLAKPHVVDHVFAPCHWQVLSCTVGRHGDWASLSDHMPVIVDFDLWPGAETRRQDHALQLGITFLVVATASERS